MKQRWGRVRSRVAAVDGVDLVLGCSLVAVVVNVHHDRVLLVATGAAAIVVLGDRRALRHPATWLGGGVVVAAWHLPTWFRHDNHLWLSVAWMVAIGLCLLTRSPRAALAVDGRLLVGSIFAIGVLWKLGSPDFRSGAFFHHALLQDDRFAWVTSSIGGIDAAVLDGDRGRVQELVAEPTTPVVLTSSDRTSQLALLFTWWGIAIEAWIAVTWLAPLRASWRWLRHVGLLAFAATTYLVVPVAGFGILLMALGLTQAGDDARLRWAYLAGLAALVVYGPVWSHLLGP